MKTTACSNNSRNHEAHQRGESPVDPALLWYVPHRRLRSGAAAADAIQLAEALRSPSGESVDRDEQEVFVAMHTCAYWASGSSRTRQLSQPERDEWIERWNVIRSYIADQNIGLVYSMAEQVRSTYLDWDGIISEGMYALLRAVDRFNPWQGFKFSTYACNIIVRAILRYRKSVVRHLDRYTTAYEGSFDRAEPVDDLSLDVNLDRLGHVLRRNDAELTGMESDVLAMRFPESGEEGKTFKQIGSKVGLSKERVRQIQHRALDKLKSVLIRDPFVAWH